MSNFAEENKDGINATVGCLQGVLTLLIPAVIIWAFVGSCQDNLADRRDRETVEKVRAQKGDAAAEAAAEFLEKTKWQRRGYRDH